MIHVLQVVRVLRVFDTLRHMVYSILHSLASLDRLFGTISRCMLSLFASVTGGVNWWDVFNPILAINWTFAVAYLIFFVFIVLGVLNIVTGIFVDKATEL